VKVDPLQANIPLGYGALDHDGMTIEDG